MDNSFRTIIEQSNSILVILPTRPYFDQVAAGLALYLSLRERFGIQIYCPNQMTVEFNRLIGINKINQELGNKNLVIGFKDYQANDIERVSYDIEDGQFRLTVIPKTKVNPPTKEQLELSYSGVSADTVILVGGVNETHFPTLSSSELAGAKIVHIGIKDITLPSNLNVVSFCSPASSVSELTATLMKESGISFDEDVSTNLLMGIEDGSNSFTTQYVSANTFDMVAQLLRAGGRRVPKTELNRNDFPEGSIPGEDPNNGLPAKAAAEPEETQKEPDVPTTWLHPKVYKGDSIS